MLMTKIILPCISSELSVKNSRMSLFEVFQDINIQHHIFFIDRVFNQTPLPLDM